MILALVMKDPPDNRLNSSSLQYMAMAELSWQSLLSCTILDITRLKRDVFLSLRLGIAFMKIIPLVLSNVTYFCFKQEVLTRNF